MIEVYIAFHILVLVYSVIQTVIDKSKIYQYPFLSTVVWCLFILPQFIGIYINGTVQEAYLHSSLLFSNICLISVHLGWYHGRLKKITRNLFIRNYYNEKYLLISAIVLLFLGAYSFYKIGQLSEDLKGTQWTGVAVAYNFFAQNVKYALILSVILVLTTSNPSIKRISILIILLCFLLYFERIVISGRKGTILELFFIVVLPFYFLRKKIIPRRVFYLSIFIGTLLTFSTADYRSGMKESNSFIETISNIDFEKNFLSILEEGEGIEVRNAAVYIGNINEQSVFDFGAFNWNELMFNYVPAQIFGQSFKSFLMIDSERLIINGYSIMNGSTMTGLYDSFYSFWYFGFIKFYLISFCSRVFYRRALEGILFFQLLYILTFSASLHCITHHTQWFPSTIVHVLIFVYPFLTFSRIRYAKTN